MDVSIVMINYNTYELTKKAVESILTFTRGIQYEIILIDNASPDNSGEKLRQCFKDKIVYIQSGDNLGTSKAFNIGAKQASGKYILWLNTDILFNDNFIYTLFDYMENNPDCGICGGNLVNSDNMPTHSFLMELPSLKSERKRLGIFNIILNKIFKRGIKRSYNFSKEPMEVGYITGADMMVRKTIVDDLNGFDEDIFMYAEETEFTFRMKKYTDYKVMSVPNAVMQHLEGASFGNKIVFNEKRFRMKLNGDSVYFDKCYGREILVKYLKLLIRSYRKLRIFNKLLLRKEKADACRRSGLIVGEKIREINRE